MAKYEALSKDIIRLVGGEKNINSLVHCATRLRFKLKDDKLADQKAVESLEGVLSVLRSGGQFQVVIGNHVSDVYAEITKHTSLNSNDTTETTKDDTKLINKIFDIITGSFQPILGAFAGAGMLKAILTLLVMGNLLTTDSGTYAVLSAAANATFYFLPVFLGISISTKLKVNPYVGGAIGASLLEPNVTNLLKAGTPTDFLGIPLILIDYSSTVFPIFIAILLFSVFEKSIKKVIPKGLQIFMVPLLSLMVMVPLTLLIFGPFGVYVGNAIGAFIGLLSAKSGLLTGAVMGASWTYLTLFGLHWGIVPILINNLSHGGDPLSAMLACAVFAQLGVALAILIKTKDKNVRALAGPAFLTGSISGVTEPILYGLLMPNKRTLIYVPVAGAIGGAINGLLGVKSVAFAFPSFFAIPSYVPMVTFMIGAFAAFGVGFLLPMVLGYENKDNDQGATKGKTTPASTSVKAEKVYAPITGKVLALSQVNDKVFSSGVMGGGIAIEPTEGKVYAPFDGIVSVIMPTKHAVGLISDQGAELLIHVGIDTVQLDGTHFTAHVEAKSHVKKGDLLLTFDMKAIEEAGYALTTPIIVTNGSSYSAIEDVKAVNVKVNDLILNLK